MILTYFEVSALHLCLEKVSLSILGEVGTKKQISMFQHEGGPSGAPPDIVQK